MFIKGSVRITLDGKTFEFPKQNISLFGVMGLPWKTAAGTIDPQNAFGKSVSFAITVPTKEGRPFSMMGKARILRESTVVGSAMSLRFYLGGDQGDTLSKLIADQGHTPAAHLRKYPRIPSHEKISAFPLRASGRSDKAPPIIFDLVNISPTGMLLKTENLASTAVPPGAQITLKLEPRGWFALSVEIPTLVCRITDEKNEENGNLTRYFGVKLLKMTEINRSAFLDLLKNILEEIKKTGVRSGDH